jgi:hypothetical protein
MRVRATLALAVLAALLGGTYYVYEVRGRGARDEALRAERRLMSFDPARVRQISVESREERIVLRGEGDRWRIVAPVDEAADERVVEGLLAFVRQLEKVRALDGFHEWRAVGLDTPVVKLGLTLDTGETLTLRLGGENPVRTGVYAAVEGAPLVFLAPKRLAAELQKTPYLEQLRDKTILAFDIERIARVEIGRHDARVTIVRAGERRWRVESPFHADGDDGIIRDLLWKIANSRAQAAIRAPESPATYGLDRPHARLRVTDDRGVTRTLAVSQSPRDQHVLYAQIDGAGVVHVTDLALLGDLAIAPELFRNRQLLVYDRKDVERITIVYPTNTLVLDRSGSRWRVTKPGEGDAAPTTVENILEVLPNLRYASVEPDREIDLRRYGLDHPRLAVTLGLTGGRELPTLAVGREARGVRFVMIGNRAPVYTVDARLIRGIPEDPADAQRYPLPEQLKRDLEKVQRGRS